MPINNISNEKQDIISYSKKMPINNISNEKQDIISYSKNINTKEQITIL
jgi:hypothetical protein